jgi:predicted DNA-binding protein (MmcQ/YjbR family)
MDRARQSRASGSGKGAARTSERQALTKLRALCLSLPETRETAAWGHPNFVAGKKTFAVFENWQGRPCIAVKQTKPDQELLLEDQRFFRTPYSGKHGWVSLWVDRRVPWKLVRELVLQSYRLVANRRMLTALEAER